MREPLRYLIHRASVHQPGHTRQGIRLASFLWPAAVTCLICLMASAVVQKAEAQRWRQEGALYVKPRLGLNTYAGDRSPGGGPVAPSTGVEVGYNRRVGTVRGDYGLYLLAGRYPGLVRGIDGATSAFSNEVQQWAFTLGVTGTVGLMPDARISPYLQLGAGTTMAQTSKGVRAAFSPIGGAGVDVAVTRQAGVFLEATGILSGPDNQIDRAESRDGRALDVFGFVGGGVRIGINKPFRPVRIIAIDGPTRLTAGQRAIFTATVNEEEASGPITYRWRLEDGTTASGSAVRHQFSAPGNYTLTVVTSNRGSTDKRLLTVSVVGVAQAGSE